MAEAGRRTDRQLAYVSNHNAASLSVIDLAAQRILTKIPVSQLPNAIAASADRGRLYVPNGGDNSISVVSTLANKVIHTIEGINLEPFGVIVSPYRQRLYALSLFTGTVLVINSGTNKIIRNIPIGNGLTGGAVSPDGSRIYFTSQEKGISVVDAATHHIVRTIPERDCWGVVFSPSGKRYYIINLAANRISVYQTSTNRRIAKIPVGKGPLGLAVSQDGSRVYVTNSGSNSISVISASANRVIHTIPVGDTPFLVALSPDNRKAYVTNSGSDTVSEVSLRINQVSKTIPAGPAPRGIVLVPVK
ncbi:YncE family protein [Paenibacillus pasadenensis]|uniref:YncE family protein n=1 Tax=Paenibacillus pasadenensis TaxID=217090 RepID=UPI00203A7232|nr:YncE family protein [Paenibacillus pasadenensis]MCM3748203.1 YncE family protein [Paenibacillus pasadenensis]